MGRTAARLSHAVRRVTYATLVVTLVTCTGREPPTAPLGVLPDDTPPLAATAGPAVLVGAGNIARCDKAFDEQTAQLLATLPGTIITLGDNVYDDASLADYQNCFSWGTPELRARMRPAAGDEDYATAGAAGYFAYFGAAAGAEGYYSYDVSTWHVVVLNSNIAMTPTSAQGQWLLRDLQANTQPCVLAYFHHPRFSSTGTSSRSEVRPLWDALYAAGADVVLNGHYRVYERFAPQSPAGVADPKGIVQFTVGTGGQGTTTFGTIRPNSVARGAGIYGVLELTLDAGSYSWRFVGLPGQSFADAGTANCHRSAPAENAPPVVNAGADAALNPGESFTLAASFTDAGGAADAPWSWSVSWGDGSAPTVGGSDAPGAIPASHTYAAAGEYTVRVTVTDARGATGADETIVRVAAVPTTAFTLVGAGQIARCDGANDEATAALLAQIPGTIFTTGDNIHATGSLSDFQTCYGASWGSATLKSRTRPAVGDEDYETSGAAGYFAWFGAAAGEAGKGYYSYDLGRWHIVVLNSNIAMASGSAQYAWLDADLRATTKPCLLAYWHHPRFSSSGTSSRSVVRPLWDLLYAAGADVVLNGHYRVYERFAPQSPAGLADPEGIVQFTVGTGGHGTASFSTPRPNSVVRGSGFGVLKLSLENDAYAWEFVPVAGNPLRDAGRAQCHVPDGPPGNEAPMATIVTPVAGATYAGGDAIAFSGTANDPEEGALPASRFTWRVDFHHDTHTHPFLPPTSGITSGSITIPTRGETADNVWYRIHLEVRDAAGLAHATFVDVQPRKATLTLATQPAGLQVTLDGQPRTTPLTVTSVVGMERDLGVVSPQTVNGTVYEFTSWSDGGAASHTISTPASNASYTATYTARAVNQPPVVRLTAPAPGGSGEVEVPVTVTAEASDPDGSLASVQFLDGTTPIGSVTPSGGATSFSISWTPRTVGTHSLTARVTDDAGAATTSAAVAFTVTSPPGSDREAPTIAITAPANGASSLSGTLTLTASASDNVGVTGVQFQVDGEDLGPEDMSAPWQATLPATSAYASGIHVIRARARDAAGNVSSWATSTVGFGGSVELGAGFVRTTYATGLAAVTAMAFAPDGRLFVCEQGGAIRVVPAGGGAALATPFHQFTVTNSGEQGLLGIAFHPDFAQNGRVYVYYTSPTASSTDPTSLNHNRVSYVVASPSNPNVSTGPSGEVYVVNDLPRVGSGGNHNGGALHFSPIDRKLYVAIGDQGSGSNSQLMTSRFGKILRLNDDGTIPTDNPFYGSATGVYRSIWSLGLRNPFTFAFHPHTGRMMINDVGQNAWEEINEGVAGSNYGWPATEGYTTNPSYRSPIFAYPHSGGLLTGYAIVGGDFYQPATTTFPAAYAGNYFFADYASGWISRLDVANDNAVYIFARTGNDIYDLKVGADGALYALALGTSGRVVYRYQAR